jgi:hypothetical protein
MDKKESINEFVEAAFNSIEHIEQAAAKPFLLSRINGRLLSESGNRWWEYAALLVGKPSFAIPGIAILMFINLTIIALYTSEPSSALPEQSVQASSDEFYFSTATIYDNENTEP